jgi:hypothetical protein
MEADRTTQCEFEAERIVSCTDMNNDSRLPFPTSKCVATESSGYSSEIIENQPCLCNLCPTVERTFDGSGSDDLSDDPGVLVASSRDDECEADNNADDRGNLCCDSHGNIGITITEEDLRWQWVIRRKLLSFRPHPSWPSRTAHRWPGRSGWLALTPIRSIVRPRPSKRNSRVPSLIGLPRRTSLSRQPAETLPHPEEVCPVRRCLQNRCGHDMRVSTVVKVPIPGASGRRAAGGRIGNKIAVLLSTASNMFYRRVSGMKSRLISLRNSTRPQEKLLRLPAHRPSQTRSRRECNRHCGREVLDAKESHEIRR